ncbi:lysozyme inhibitor LprI family protein [Sphingomonas sp. R86521]|uniref:lysozyme inhibitor LprI family protein n=1 Tax=Sphingomonas sp. R86521 TaxID=3093860 RepID=UPI0036D213AB
MLITGSLGSVPVAAAAPQDVTEGFSRAYQACITYGETHNTTAIPEGECDAREMRAQDARLNAAYKAVVARLSPTRKADLRTDERNWIVARDQKCGKLPDPDLVTECKIDQTIKRTAYLRRYK